MPVYHTDAGTVETLEWGDGPELLVLLHAAAAGPQSLSALAALLQRPGRRIVAPALNRYGATAMHDEADRVGAHFDVLRACLALCPAERRVLFGHSMGGLIGLLGACNGLPMNAVVLYEPIVTACLRRDHSDEAVLLEWDRSILAQVEQSLAQGDPAAGMAAFVDAWNEVPWASLSTTARARLAAGAQQLAADMHDVSHYALPVEVLCRAPGLILLQGKLSPPITHAMTSRLAASLPGAQRVLVPGCGHMGPVYEPAALADIVSGFL